MKRRMMGRAKHNRKKGKEMRSDDIPEVMDKRIATFFKSQPIFDQFEKAGKLRKVDSSGSKDQTASRIE